MDRMILIVLLFLILALGMGVSVFPHLQTRVHCVAVPALPPGGYQLAGGLQQGVENVVIATEITVGDYAQVLLLFALLVVQLLTLLVHMQNGKRAA